MKITTNLVAGALFTAAEILTPRVNVIAQENKNFENPESIYKKEVADVTDQKEVESDDPVWVELGKKYPFLQIKDDTLAFHLSLGVRCPSRSVYRYDSLKHSFVKIKKKTHECAEIVASGYTLFFGEEEISLSDFKVMLALFNREFEAYQESAVRSRLPKKDRIDMGFYRPEKLRLRLDRKNTFERYSKLSLEEKKRTAPHLLEYEELSGEKLFLFPEKSTAVSTIPDSVFEIERKYPEFIKIRGDKIFIDSDYGKMDRSILPNWHVYQYDQASKSFAQQGFIMADGSHRTSKNCKIGSDLLEKYNSGFDSVMTQIEMTHSLEVLAALGAIDQWSFSFGAIDYRQHMADMAMPDKSTRVRGYDIMPEVIQDLFFFELRAAAKQNYYDKIFMEEPLEESADEIFIKALKNVDLKFLDEEFPPKFSYSKLFPSR